MLLTGFGVALLEAFHAAGGIYHAPLASIEGVAGAAKLYLERFLGRAGGEFTTARARNLGVGKIFRVNFLFHVMRTIQRKR